MIFTADDVRDLHFDIVHDIDEMENPRAIRAADRHVRMRVRVREIEFDAAANEIVHDDLFARRAEAPRAVVLEQPAAGLELLEVALINVEALALEVRPEVAAGLGTFVPIEPEPAHPA